MSFFNIAATYSKKVADLNQRSTGSTPMGILPVGYPVFLPCTNEAEAAENSSGLEEMSPVNVLPDPAIEDSGGPLQLHGLVNNEKSSNKLGAPLRQSPASSIPPVLPDSKEDTTRFVCFPTYF